MSFLERPTRPDKPEAINERQDFFRRAITSILKTADYYKMQPGSHLSLEVPPEKYSDIDNCFGFSVILGLPPLGDDMKKAVVFSAFLDWKDLGCTENRLSYFCGTYPQFAREELQGELGSELLLGREKPVFPSLLDRNTISKRHMVIRSRRNQGNIIIDINDGISGRPSSYGSTVFIPHLSPEAISHTGVVEPKKRSPAQPIEQHSPFPAK